MIVQRSVPFHELNCRNFDEMDCGTAGTCRAVLLDFPHLNASDVHGERRNSCSFNSPVVNFERLIDGPYNKIYAKPDLWRRSGGLKVQGAGSLSSDAPCNRRPAAVRSGPFATRYLRTITVVIRFVEEAVVALESSDECVELIQRIAKLGLRRTD